MDNYNIIILYTLLLSLFSSLSFLPSTQHPSEFATVMQDSVQSRSNEVMRKAVQVKAALEEIVILISSKQEELATQHNHKQEQQNWAKPAELLSITGLGRKGKAAGKRGKHASKTSPPPLSSCQPPASGGVPLQAVQVVLGEFVSLMEEAVRDLVVRTHTKLCKSICHPDVIAATMDAIRRSLGQREERGDRTGRRGGGGGGGGGRGRKEVKLQLWMKFSIPSVVTLDPSIEEVNEHVGNISSSILSVLEHLPSWMGSEGEVECTSVPREIRNVMELEQILMQKHFEG